MQRLARHAVIGISVVSPLVAFNTELTIRLIRRHNPTATIILGGHHATFFAEEWLARGADVIVRREGERTFQQVVRALAADQSLADLAGISIRDESGAIRHHPDAPFVENLDDLPLPNWDLMDFSLYRLRLIPGGPPASIETSRGCPNQCAFCAASAMWLGRQRFRTADHVLAQLEQLHARGVEQLFIADDNFGQHAERDARIFEEILRRGYRFGIMALARADLAAEQPELIALAARAGLKMVLVGFESTQQEALDQYRKKLKCDLRAADFRRIYDVYHRHGVFVYGLFILDSYLPAARSNAWAEYRGFKQISDFASLQSFVPMRGIPALDEMRDAGYQIHDTFYRDRFTPGFRRGGAAQSLSFAALNVYDLLRPASLRRLWSRDFTTRSIFRSLYRGLLADARKITPLGLRAFLMALLRIGAPEMRRRKLMEAALTTYRLPTT